MTSKLADPIERNGILQLLHEIAGVYELDLSASLLRQMAVAMEQQGALDPWVCGQVYEQQLALAQGRKKAAGIYYTPKYVVDYVVERTLGRVLSGLSVEEILKLQIVDPSCGGGIFLLTALDYIAQYVYDLAGGSVPGWRRRVALECLHGLDRDPTAVATCRLALGLAIGPEQDVQSFSVHAVDTLIPRDTLKIPCVDVVLGNPPWGQKMFRFSSSETEYLRANYCTAKGVLDPFKLFLERIHDLLRMHGLWAFVLPDVLLLKNYEVVRRFLLRHSCIQEIVHAGRVFPGVNLDAIVVIGQRCIPPVSGGKPVRIWHVLPENWQEQPPQTHSISSHVFETLPGARFNIYLDEPTLALVQRLQRFPRFGDRFEVHEGVHSGNVRAKLFVGKRRNEHCVPLIVGRKELDRFRLRWGGKYLDLAPGLVDRRVGEYANLGKCHWHQRKKIVIRRTGDKVVAAYDKVGYYCSNNLFVVFPKAASMHRYSLRCYVGLLNSPLLTWFFRAIQPRVGRLFAELKIQHIVDFPLPPLDTREAQEKFVALGEVVERLEAQQEPTTIPCSALERMDGLVNGLYALTQQEVCLFRGSAK